MTQQASFYNDIWKLWVDFVRYYPASIHRRKYVLSQIKKLGKWTSLADFGCGNGILINIIYDEFKYENKTFTGIDVSNEQIELNSQLFPYIHFEACDFSHDKPKNQFDVISCSEVIEHIDDYKQAIKNLSDSLKAGGHCIITVPTGEIFSTEKTFGHLKHFTKKEIIEEFAVNNVQLVKCQTWGFPFHDLAKYAANINYKGTLKKYANGKLSFTSKLVFRIVNLFYYLNILPCGKQLYFIGKKV